MGGGVDPRAAVANFVAACIPQGSGCRNRVLFWKRSQFEIVHGDEPGFLPREFGLQNRGDKAFFFLKTKKWPHQAPTLIGTGCFFGCKRPWRAADGWASQAAAPGEHIVSAPSTVFGSHFTQTCVHPAHIFFNPLRIYEIKMNQKFYLVKENNFALCCDLQISIFSVFRWIFAD